MNAWTAIGIVAIALPTIGIIIARLSGPERIARWTIHDDGFTTIYDSPAEFALFWWMYVFFVIFRLLWRAFNWLATGTW